MVTGTAIGTQSNERVRKLKCLYKSATVYNMIVCGLLLLQYLQRQIMVELVCYVVPKYVGLLF